MKKKQAQKIVPEHSEQLKKKEIVQAIGQYYTKVLKASAQILSIEDKNIDDNQQFDAKNT